ncbi:MAG TPA: MTH938/NDUFAF3 family protein [Hyphomicrobiaceae bacterium]|jgi:uncharacterized protein|nr:MTH938/NDUFAF3 family protein [Hyphomicrobiaceae bacterium]
MSAPPACYPGRAAIDAYGNGGFRFAGMSHRGSILCLPSGIYAWAPARPEDISLESLAPALTEGDGLDLLLLGSGRVGVMPAWELRQSFADLGVALESMDTGAACRTYNVLLAEARPIAAALIAVN